MEGHEDIELREEALARIENVANSKLDSDQELCMSKLGLLSVPKQLLGLRTLRSLNLRANRLSMVPTELCERLVDLEFLNLSENRIQYLPENISSLARLRTFRLQSNELTELPDGIGRLPLLTELRLEHNHLERLPGAIGKLSTVKTLTLSYNQLTELPMSMAGMRCLESLDVSENPLAYDELPEFIHTLNELYALLHSKTKRRTVVHRAVNIRRGIRQAVLEELASEPAEGD